MQFPFLLAAWGINKKSDEFGQLFNAELLRQKRKDKAVLSLHLRQDHGEYLNLLCSSVMQVSNAAMRCVAPHSKHVRQLLQLFLRA